MEKKCLPKNNIGFTLIELVLVIAIISLLAIVALVAIRPAQRLADARDARRAQDINQVLSGIHQCVIDKKDTLTMGTCLGSLTVGNTYEIVTAAGITSGCQAKCTGATSDSSCLRLDATLADYFVTLPKDPGGVATSHTGYSVTLMSNGMTVIEACTAENMTIKVSR
jgi:prepilin-type N-terminal cleavage/methylation domain-containing protein